jgi:site-specific DNA-methyltransferase (adenine-specific)
MLPYFRNDKITLYHGDCLEVLPTLTDINFVLADPPYGTTQNRWDAVIPFEPMWATLNRSIKENAAIALCASQPFSSALVMSNPKLFRHEWIWIKNRGSNFANTVREPMKEHESVLVFARSQWTYNKQMQERTGGGKDLVGKRVGTGQKQREGVGKFKAFDAIQSLSELRVPSSWQKFNTEVGLHPTQKPLSLMRYLIRTYTNEGDTVLDFTCGSGTTLLAAAIEGRKAIGIEKEEKYCEVTRSRCWNPLPEQLL